MRDLVFCRVQGYPRWLVAGAGGCTSDNPQGLALHYPLGDD